MDTPFGKVAMTIGVSEELTDSQATLGMGGQERSFDDVKAGLLGRLAAEGDGRRTPHPYQGARDVRRAVIAGHTAKLEEAVLYVRCLLGTRNPKPASFGLEIPKPGRRPTPRSRQKRDVEAQLRKSGALT